MKRVLFLLLLLAISLPGRAQVKVRFELQAIPKAGDAAPVYFVAGNFNNWSPNDANSQFSKTSDGKYILEKNLPANIYEFKITRGSWDKVECNSKGQAIANRSFSLQKDTVVQLLVANWADGFKKEAPKSTASSNVYLLDSVFKMPQLQTSRRIWIYLPPSYAQSRKKYPVLYMHDGQNLFDSSTSGYGEWGVDEILDSLSAKTRKEYIVVGIDHGGSERLKEYNPYDSQYGKGRGKDYVAFLVNTLKPYIDKHYRTLKDSKNTAIAGSSMGGLISMYAITAYPKVFGKAGVFSPAFWLGKAIETDLKNAVTALKGHQIYLVAGELEGKMMIKDMENVYQILVGEGKDEGEKSKEQGIKNKEQGVRNKEQRVGNIDVKLVKKADGKHSEWFWHREFPAFYDFISN